ncbi:unnamed protein product [Mytilus edulis]|uniref:Uncharacterized protein n=1 Tax=Mytilus edulis TaxID=6550 RepID=A0A8S3VNG8_MYTED|nr:unnamed protein product [Mytilus edulis]
MYPNTEPGFPLFQNLVYMPYWQLYGELFLEQFYVQDNNELVWKFHRFSLIQEYYDRSSLVPPFIILSHLKIFILYIKNRCTEITETDAENEKLAILEKDAVYSHLNSSTRLRRRRARNMDAEKDGFEASYEKDTDLSLQEQINVLSSDVDIILKTVKQIMATKTECIDSRGS